MATKDEVDPCVVLDTLCQKHSRLSSHATTSPEKAKQVLSSPAVARFKDEIDFISKQIAAEKENKTDDEKDKDETKIVFHLTGFGQFGSIKDNPTTHLINSLPAYLYDNKDIPSNVTVASMNVLHVSGVNSLKKLKEIRASNDKEAQNTVYVYLHFGVAASRKNLCLESVAYNCANFKGCPDELGWAPFNEMIVKENENIYHEYCTQLPVDVLTVLMAKKRGYDVEKSTDPGRYVCNWILYNSLHLSYNRDNEYNMFVHVPQHDKINEDTQCQFARDLVIEIANLLNWK
eukprot:145618_1